MSASADHQLLLSSQQFAEHLLAADRYQAVILNLFNLFSVLCKISFIKGFPGQPAVYDQRLLPRRLSFYDGQCKILTVRIRILYPVIKFHHIMTTFILLLSSLRLLAKPAIGECTDRTGQA